MNKFDEYFLATQHSLQCMSRALLRNPDAIPRPQGHAPTWPFDVVEDHEFAEPINRIKFRLDPNDMDTAIRVYRLCLYTMTPDQLAAVMLSGSRYGLRRRAKLLGCLHTTVRNREKAGTLRLVDFLLNQKPGLPIFPLEGSVLASIARCLTVNDFIRKIERAA